MFFCRGRNGYIHADTLTNQKAKLGRVKVVVRGVTVHVFVESLRLTRAMLVTLGSH